MAAPPPLELLSPAFRPRLHLVPGFCSNVDSSYNDTDEQYSQFLADRIKPLLHNVLLIERKDGCNLVRFGAIWCNLVKARTKEGSGPVRRFTVTLDAAEYEQLEAVAAGHKPPLPLRYVVQYAVRLLLERAKDPQFMLRLGDPLRKDPSEDA